MILDNDNWIIIDKDASTEAKYGCPPEDRSIEQLLQGGWILLDKPLLAALSKANFSIWGVKSRATTFTLGDLRTNSIAKSPVPDATSSIFCPLSSLHATKAVLLRQ